MKFTKCGVLSVVFLILTQHTFTLSAANTATQIVSMSVCPINIVSIVGTPPVLIINNGNPGELPSPASSTGITWGYTTTSTATTGKKVTGNIDTIMPANTYLSVNLAAPMGATSAGDVQMTTTPIALVTGIPVPSLGIALDLTYTFGLISISPSLSTFTRTFTLTLLDS